jgi:preprotein translocase subunit SecA
VILAFISETILFSGMLTSNNIPHTVLTDTQAESEDFAMQFAREPGTMNVATNTAGRGTDTRPSRRVLLRADFTPL